MSCAALSGCAGFTGPLQTAAAGGDTQKVKLMLAQGQDPNTLNKYGRSALFAAAYKGHLDMVKLLLDRGADADQQEPGGWYPLQAAARFGYVDIVKLLLDRGARLDLRTGPPLAWTAYEWAEEFHQYDAAALIKRVAEQRGVGYRSGGSSAGLAAGVAAPEPTGDSTSAAPPPAQTRHADMISDVDEPRYKRSAERPDDFALVIGISKYRDIPEAEFADKDAQAFKRHLITLGYPEENIITLIGDRATKGSLEEKLERWLPMNVSDKSTLFVYYSGHGAPDPESQEAYLVPWDGQPQALKDTAFALSRLYKDLQKLPAKRVIVALDACFSGAGGRSVLAKGARPLVARIETSVPHDGKLVVFTASQSDQISGTLEDKGHGVFTYYFLKGLNGEASSDDSGHVTVGALYSYLAKRVSVAARRQEREQNPQLLPSVETAGSIQIR